MWRINAARFKRISICSVGLVVILIFLMGWSIQSGKPTVVLINERLSLDALQDEARRVPSEGSSQPMSPDLHDEAFRIGVIKSLGSLQIELETAQSETIPEFKKPQSTKRIIIATTWRTGSSFLGELIYSAPGVFYSFEPLHFLDYHKPKPNTTTMELLHSIYDCQFTTDYLMHVTKRSKGGQPYLQINTRVWEPCHQFEDSLCVEPDFIGHLCKHFPVQLVKEVRLTLDQIEGGLVDEDYEWKVVYLIRDPRAIMASRRNFQWCKNDPNCGSVEHLCNDTEKDLALLKRLMVERPDRYYLVKYEDLSSDLESGTKDLFHFLGLPFTDSVKLFLRSHTRETAGGLHGTYRLLNSTITTWRTKLSAKDVASMSKTCASVLSALNYPPS